MATEKIGIYRKWLERPPVKDGHPIPKTQWAQKRRHCWEIRWFGLSGKRYSKSYSTRNKAERFARELQEKINHGKADKPAKILLKDFVEEHKKIMAGQIAPASLYEQVRALRFFEKFIGGSTPIQAITPRHAEMYISHRISSGVSTASVNKDIMTLKRVFNLAISPREYLVDGHNPFQKIKQRKKTGKPIRYVSVSEYLKLLDSTDKIWWKALISLAYGSGLRKEEILNLTWNDVDFENKRIHVQAKKSSSTTIEWEPKDHDNRFVPMTDRSTQILADLLTNGTEGLAYVFIGAERLSSLRTMKKRKAWDPLPDTINNLGRDFEVIRKRSGIERCTIHDLRRSAITNWAQHLPIQVVQQLAGHSNITTTRKYYLTVRAEDMTKASQVVNQILEVVKPD
jgi:integrase